METDVIVALITLGGLILVALIPKIWDSLSSLIIRKRSNIPNIINTKWVAKWYKDDFITLYVEDRIEITKWKTKNTFIGQGIMTHSPNGEETQYIYPIEGEIYPNRIMVFTYKAEKYPTEGLIGTVCMQLEDTAKEINGFWIGKTKNNDTGTYELKPGKVKMTKIQ